MPIHERMRDAGMSPEERYFYEKNKELIDKRRAALDADREAQRKHELKEKHWMRCPKCGHELVEEEHAGIMVDRCTDCHGMFFDAGELELLLAAREPQGFLTGLKNLLR